MQENIINLIDENGVESQFEIISLSLKLYTLKVDTKLINSNNNKINPFFFTFLTPS